MRSSTLVGLLLGGAVVITGTVAIAASRRHLPPYFEYRVQPGDNLSDLALRFFGDAEKWPALLERFNTPFNLIDKLPVGLLIPVPCIWHTVKSGDTLTKIAQEVLHDGGRWRRIWEANRSAIPDPDKLEIGRALAVPMVLPVSTSAPAPSAVGLDCLGAVEI